jgi:hypothetical protein
VASYLILYNIPVLWIRWNGIRWGYEYGEKVVEKLKRLRLNKSTVITRRTGLALTLLLAVMAIFYLGTTGKLPTLIRTGTFLFCLGMKYYGIDSARAYGILIGLGLVVAYSFS